MILKEITLENFRVFKGTHTIKLTPNSKQPIVLFGGLNGAGKTSLLMAVRFAFLGRQAFAKTMTNPAYQEQLNKLINNNLEKLKPETAYIKLVFDYARDGEILTYIIEREWAYNKLDDLSVKEEQNTLSTLNQEQAQSFLFEIIPPGVADLVFFDGEKIAELAEDNSGNILKEAIGRLLGLDIVKRLQEDLRIYLKRAGNATEQCNLEEDYALAEAKKDELLAEARYLRNQADFHFNAITELNRQIAQSEQSLMNLGGAWASSRKKEQEKINQLISEKATVEANLITYLESDYVFGFANNTMNKLMSKVKESSEWHKRKDFSNQLAIFLSVQNSINDQNIKASLQLEANKFTDSSIPKVPLEVTEKQISILEIQNSNGANQYLESMKLKQKFCDVELQIENASTNVARAPEEEQLEKSVLALRGLEKTKSQQVNTYKAKLLEAKGQFKKAQDLASKLAKLQKVMKSKFGDSDSALRASRSIFLLQDFDSQLTALKVKQISENFSKSYKKLARKEHLNFKAKICPKDFSVYLENEDGSLIDKKSLSAGEKQIFAIAMIDALASVAGKTLPLVIDTPLGRLDSAHRDKLVEHYFPHASKQVIILSTDTEIGEEYLEKLSPYVSHKYDIHFDKSSNTSEVRKGYFKFSQEQSA